MANWGANHTVTIHGHIGADLITMASMLRIPVSMHNVHREKYIDLILGQLSGQKMNMHLIIWHAKITDQCINNDRPFLK